MAAFQFAQAGQLSGPKLAQCKSDCEQKYAGCDKGAHSDSSFSEHNREASDGSLFVFRLQQTASESL